MYERLLPAVLEAYGVKPSKIFDSQKGYRNEIWPILTSDNSMISVIFYKREPDIINRVRCADKVSEYLAIHGVPVRRRIENKLVSLKSSRRTVNAGVYNYLPGETIAWEAYAMDHIKNLGAAMGKMHLILSNMETQGLPSVYEEYLALLDRMSKYLANPKVEQSLLNKLGLKIDIAKIEQYINLLNEYHERAGQQALHMDFVRGNILFEGEQVSGILDFEKTAKGHTVMDVARTLAFLLVDCKYKQTKKVYKYFLFSGYQKRGQNKDIGDDKARNQFVAMFLLYDLYKFLLHNPYESLPQNEHFVRTRDILEGYGVVLLS